MQQKWIAGLLVLVTLSWASSIALPPPEPAMAAIPAVKLSPSSQSHSGNHDCCPGLKAPAPVAPVPSMPCGNHHRCCISGAPDVPASLPQRSEVTQAAPSPLEKIEIAQGASTQIRPDPLVLDTSQTYLDLSMVLRN